MRGVVIRAETGASEIPPTILASAARTNLNTTLIMNAKKNTIQTSKQAQRKVSSPGPARATSLTRQTTGPVPATTRRKSASGETARSRNCSLAEPATVVEARIDVGMGNRLFIRGQGDGLSWFKGVPLHCAAPTTWVWSTTQAGGKVVFKLLLNDQVWAKGEDVVVEAGRKIEVVPFF